MSQWREPVEACALGVLACSEEQVRGAVVVDIFAVDSILDVEWTMTFSQNSGIRSQKGTPDSHDVIYRGTQYSGEGGEEAQAEC
jgi:hypothetical protein